MKSFPKLISWLLVIALLITNLLPAAAQGPQTEQPTTNLFLPIILGGGESSEFSASAVNTPPGAFNKSSPSKDAINVATPVTLRWSSSAGATQYGYCIASTNACPNSDAGYTRLNATSVTVNLEPGRTYFWQVRAYNAANEMTPANGTNGWWQFTTAATPGAFSKITPAENATNIPTLVALQWASTVGADEYGYCLASTAACPNSDAGYTRLNSTNVTLSLQPGTTYFWQVRAYNAAGYTPANGTTNWWRFTTNPNGVGSFGKATPTNGATDVATLVALSWQAATNAVGYGYCIDTTLDSRCDQGSDNYVRLTETTVVLALNPNTSYQWQARAYAADGSWMPADGSGAWWGFSTKANGAGPFSKIAPGNSSTNVAPTVTLSWQPAQNATGYGYCIDTTLDNRCDRGADNYIRVSGTTAALALDPGKSYEWQVRAFAADGSWMPANGSGAWWRFSTDPNGTPPFGKLAPTNGATNVARSVTLQWQAAPGATGYGYCIDTTLDNGCDRGLNNYIRTANTRVTLTLEANRTYQWQARAYAANGEWTPANGVGQWWSFTTEGTAVSGYIPGDFRVSEAGAATYHIPLALPGGTGGMAPQLALTYDSRGGNTLSAWGWSLSGLSTINRCPTTLAQHNFIDGVDFDGNDQFCLDGQLLVAVQGVYGADQTVYRTENESFKLSPTAKRATVQPLFKCGPKPA